MITMTPRGLGAYPPEIPPRDHPKLREGYEWYRIMDSDTGRQRRDRCPSDAPTGCTVIRDPDPPYYLYAWGQRPIPSAEFTPTETKPRSAPSLSPPQVTLQYQTTPTGETKTTTVQPDKDKIAESCRKLYDQWAKANPAKAECMRPEHIQAVHDICMAVYYHKTVSVEDGLNATEDVVKTACRDAQPPPSPPPASPDLVPHDPSGGGGAGGASMPGPGPNGGDGAVAPPADEPSALQKWGPVVGIGLLVAGGLTMLRKRKRRR